MILSEFHKGDCFHPKILRYSTYMTYVSPTWFPPLQLTLLFKYYCRFCVLLYNSGPYHLFPIRYGTEWDVVSIGCTNCIKINFADGVVLFLAVYYGAILIY